MITDFDLSVDVGDLAVGFSDNFNPPEVSNGKGGILTFESDYYSLAKTIEIIGNQWNLSTSVELGLESLMSIECANRDISSFIQRVADIIVHSSSDVLHNKEIFLQNVDKMTAHYKAASEKSCGARGVKRKISDVSPAITEEITQEEKKRRL